MPVGTLRIYLGAAPGVGTTYAMLEEGTRRLACDTDVAVGYVECHGRQDTLAAMGKLEVIPPTSISYGDTQLTEMDVAAVLARKPALVLIDEFAHSNTPGARNAKRWQDVKEILQAGINVLSTLNIQHLESVNDIAEKITGIPQPETVPDAVVRQANEIHLVDQTPEALRRRMADGNIYCAGKIDPTLSSYLRVGSLTALRQLALLWVADRVEDGRQRCRVDHDIEATRPTHERVVVALTGGHEGATLIRRAARIAARAGGAELVAVHIARPGRAGADSTELATQRALTESLGGSYHVVRGTDPAQAIVDFANGRNATQLVLGASRRKPVLARITGPGIGVRTVQLSGDVDVHIVTHEHAAGRPQRSTAAWRNALWPSWPRAAIGAALSAALLSLATMVLSTQRGRLNLLSDVLVFLLITVVAALASGLVIATITAVSASLLLNYYFTAPLHRFTISEANNSLALVVFIVVAVIVAMLVDRSERRRRQAARASAEAETLATVAGSVLRGESALLALLEQLRETFGMRAVALFERADGKWRVAGSVGARPPPTPDTADVVVPADGTTAMVLSGPVLGADDQRVLRAFAIQAAAALRTERLAAEAEQSGPLREVDRTRTALLAAVSHDLRSPLAGAKAAVSSLRDTSVEFSDEDRAELLATADESLDRLARLVANLLDMSRLQAGAMAVSRTEVDIEEVVARAVDSLGAAAEQVKVNNLLLLPAVSGDAGVLERVLGNLLENAVRMSPPDQPALVSASARNDRIEIRVADHGPGIPEDARQRVFLPFQRLGDTTNTVGVGLGLALARGFTEAIGGSLTPEETPGGGLTMVVSLQMAPASATADPGEPDHRPGHASTGEIS